MSKPGHLTVRQRRFAEEYVIDFNGSAACVRAGYSRKYPDKHAHILLKTPAVRAYVDELSRSKEAKIMSVNPDYVLKRVLEIVDAEGAKNSDKLRGLELLARHLGMLTDKTEITGKDGGAIEIEQRNKEAADSFLSTIKGMAKKKDVILDG